MTKRLSLLLLVTLGANALGAEPTLSAPPLTPAESLKKIHVPAGFKVELVAAEPLVLDPVAFDWDETGRLWVVEMADYPLGIDGKGKPGGRVRILEDTDHDGRYDKATVFASGLSFPTGILTWRDGCLITAAPDILFLRDRDRDGKADVPETLFTGFNAGNQQLRVNGLRWGLDGWVYCANGGHNVNYGKEIRITSVRTGETIALGARDFRFDPDTGAFDPLSGPAQFGRNRDAWGHWFGTQNSFPIWHYIIEDRYLRRNPHVAPHNPKIFLTESNPAVFPVIPPEKRYHSFAQAGRFTSACAAMIYLDRLLFDQPGAQQHAFVCEPFHNLVQHLELRDDSVTFKVQRVGEEKLDFFASEDRWCRPVMTRTGPDGALWIADMYRYMIEHPDWLPKQGKDELLPHYRAGDDRGRIYRTFPENKRPESWTHLSAKSTTEELVALLASPNGWVRDKAQMILLWRDDKAIALRLETLIETTPSPLGRLHAQATLAKMGMLRRKQLTGALRDPFPGVREQALRLAEKYREDDVVAAAAELVRDPDPKVRLQLACSLGEWTQAVAGEALVALALHEREPAIRGAVLSSILPHMPAFALKVQGDPELLSAVLQTALGENRHSIVFDLVQARLAKANVADLVTIRGVRTLLISLAAKSITLETLAAKHAAEKRWSALVERKNQLLDAARNHIPRSAPNERALYASLLLCDSAERDAAIVIMGGLLAPEYRIEPLSEYISELAQLDDPRVPDILLRHWDQRTPAERNGILDALMSRAESITALLTRVREGKLPRSSFDAQRQARVLKHPATEIRRLASEVFAGTAARPRQEVLDAFRPALSLSGDVVNGKRVFAATCAACHELEGMGRPLGPDLRSVVQHATEKLLSAILDPNADIQPGFTAYFCELQSGEQLYGTIAGETGASIMFKLLDGATRTILRDEMKSLQSSKMSLMPEGLESALTPQSLADLIAYLQVPK